MLHERNLIGSIKQSKEKRSTPKSSQINRRKAFSSLDRGAVCCSRSRSVPSVHRIENPLLLELNLTHRDMWTTRDCPLVLQPGDEARTGSQARPEAAAATDDVKQPLKDPASEFSNSSPKPSPGFEAGDKQPFHRASQHVWFQNQTEEKDRRWVYGITLITRASDGQKTIYLKTVTL